MMLIVWLLACVSQSKIEYYDLPAGIAEEARIANLNKIEKGRILYNNNCAGCHNSKKKRRIIIPDFTTDQLESYTIRIQNKVHVERLPETNLTAEDLESIQLFFTYKKPGQPLKKGEDATAEK